MSPALHGLVAAPHTPFRADGALDLAVVEPQAAHLLAGGVNAAFVGGTTGECHSLTLEERTRLAGRWLEVTRGTPLEVVVHVGSNCLADARALAAQAEALGARAIAAMAPSYFKPASVDALVACCADVAAAAPGLPFYFYDIPSMTGVRFPMPDFLARAETRIPTLRGLKFTNTDLMAYQQCLSQQDGRFDVCGGSTRCSSARWPPAPAAPSAARTTSPRRCIFASSPRFAATISTWPAASSCGRSGSCRRSRSTATWRPPGRP